MSKYCPDTQCDFWEDFPQGMKLENAKMCFCFCCGKQLITEDPRVSKDISQKSDDAIENLIPPQTSSTLPSHIKSESQGDVDHSEGKNFIPQPDHDLGNSEGLVIDLTVNTELEDVTKEEETIGKSESKRKRPDSHLPETDHESKKLKKSTPRSNSQQKGDSIYSDISDSSTGSDTPTPDAGKTDNTAKLKSKPTTNPEKPAQTDKPNKDTQNLDTIAPRKGIRSESTVPSHMSNETASGSSEPDTPCVKIKFNTLILNEFYSNVNGVHLKIFTKGPVCFQSSTRMEKVEDTVVTSGEFVTLCGTINFPTKYIQKNTIQFPYKYYFVYDEIITYEDLYQPYLAKVFFNRYFKIEYEAFDNNTYDQFDMMILPPGIDVNPASLLGFMRKAYNFITHSGSVDKSIIFKDIYERRLCSLQVLLPSCFGSIHSKDFHSLETYIEQFQYIVNSLIDCKFQSREKSFSHVHNTYKDGPVESWEFYAIHNQGCPTNKLVIDWLLTTCNQNIESDPKSIVYMFYLACYFIHQYKLKNEDLYLKLINLIVGSLEPILTEKCYEFDNLIGLPIQKDLRCTIQIAVSEFLFTKVMKGKHHKQLIRLIPIYHCMNNFSEHPPLFHDSVYEDMEYWGFPSDTEFTYRGNIAFTEFTAALHFVKYDPVLPYSILLYSLHQANVKRLYEYFRTNLEHIPLSVFMSALLLRLKQNNYMNLWTELFKCLISTFKDNSNNLGVDDIDNLNLLTLTFVLKLPLNITREKFILCLELLSRGLMYCDSKSCNSLIPSKDFKSFFDDFVKKWHSKNYIKDKMTYKDYQKEIEFWQHFIADYPFPESTSIPTLVEEFLVVRYKDTNMTQQYIIDIFLLLHRDHSYSHLLRETFLKELTNRLQIFRPEEKSKFISRLSEQMSDPGQLDQVVGIFTKILLDEKQNFEVNPINHFFSWSSWKIYFDLFISNNNNKIISEDAQGMLDRALTEYSTLTGMIHSFTLSISKIEKIRIKLDYFFSLTERILSDNELQDVKTSLQTCFTMSSWVEEQRKSLKLLNGLIENLQNIDGEIISSFLATISSDTLSIKDICIRKGDSISFCPEYSKINEIINFPAFNSICEASQSFINSKIIFKVVNIVIEEKQIPRGCFDIRQFHQEIWVPVWDSCVQILKKFSEESILISDMCLYFNNSLSSEDITRELILLKSGCSVYSRTNKFSTPCFKSCVDKIHHYFQFQLCSEAAICICELKEALLIKKKYERIHNLRDISVTFENKQLSQVDAKISGVATKLSKLSNLDVILAFIDKISFVNWIRENLKDLNEVKTFVDISLTTCGGNPVDIDRITCLSSVCTNFAPLIFRLKHNTSYDELIARCREVIENVEKNKGLTKLLRQVGDSISFWEDLKRSHGSVEETTLMQLHNIMSYGVFHLEVRESLTLSEIVSLRIERGESEDKIYSLEQLNDFRSKIMLVVSKSYHTEEYTEMSNSYEKSQLFTQKLDLLIEIAKIVIKLIETGNKKYQKYDFKSIADEIESVQLLTKEKADLANILESWKQKLEEARDKYYFLNYYTISQIVSLQNGITSFTNDKEDLELEQLYHLLRLINQEVTKEDIQRALEMTGDAPKHSLNRYPITHTSDFSTQSLSAAITQYPFINQTHSITPASKSNFNQTHNEFVEFPETFSLTEIEIARSVSRDTDLSLNLTIRGITELSTDHTCVLSEESLLHWCLSNETIDDNSTNLETVTEYFPIASSSIQTSPDVDVGCTDFYQLGRILESIYNSSDGKLRAKRELPYPMKLDTLNLVVIPSENILTFVLSLYYSENEKLPLPFYHEVLVCTTHTHLEDIEIFWRRAVLVGDKSNFYLFCMIGIENLRYEVAVRAVSKFKQIQEFTKSAETRSGYKLVLVCSEEKEESSYMAAAFENCKVPTVINKIQRSDMRSFVKRKLSCVSLYSNPRYKSAWEVDRDRYRVRLVVSDSVGAGKSHFVNNVKSKLLLESVVTNEEMEEAVVTVSVHGKIASEEDITQQLLKSRMGVKHHGVMFHVDIASTVQLGLELILFKLIILRGVCKRSGEFWHCRNTDYYIIEMTLASDTYTKSSKIYPNIHCRQPFNFKSTKKNFKREYEDLEELRGEKYQRVNDYLKWLEGHYLSDFTFHPAARGHEINLIDNLRRFVNHCGIEQPSWTEIRNFVTFLDKQLSDCDNSDYCKSSTMAEEWKGFKKFVVKFMILMSRDFATPSLRQHSIINSEDDEDNALAKFEICERRRWENSSHPYIFFHPDGHTMTFLGFHVSNEGDLLDSDDPSIVLEEQIMHPELFQILTANRVNLSEKIDELHKMEKIMKVAGVMGIKWVLDPDHEYVLTLDNMRKILAIHMRFRCDIPVVHKLRTAGLGFFTKSSNTFDRLGDIPLRELVYRVMELPASMRPYVWDFGQLSDEIERSYTREIVSKHVSSSSIRFPDGSIDVISEVLAGSQHFMRSRKDECSFVSLRDVERAMRVMIWFYSKIKYFRPEDTEDLEPELISIDDITYSLILSLAVCYRARLKKREKFDKYIVRLFKRPLTELKSELIHEEVDRCQNLILNQMDIGVNIAKNTALKENVFMMFVCIELKIPLFVIGKPGSSKSLAKSIISNSMQGSRSPDGSILQKFKQVQIMSFQCSQLSTADGIIGVFKSCRNLQRKTGGNKFVACVVLDEVGLAEDSPLLPLKVLHPLLEDNSYGSEELENDPYESDNMETEMNVLREMDPAIEEVDEMKDRVAFIGISNWSLDPAKMNRGIMLSRGDPDLGELVESARGICKTNTAGSITNSIEKRIRCLAAAYLHLIDAQVSQGREYFGLRDFYCLIKMLVFLCCNVSTTLNRTILYHAVKRNFGGVSGIDAFEVFQRFVKLPKEDNENVPDSSPIGLIRANLENLSRSFHGETRYLLLLTENYAALNILSRSPDMWPSQLSFNNIRVIFGSSFPCEQEYSAVCLNINRIKDCMETGKTIILLNLENLYESLYDALNQYYMEMNNQRYVDLGLGTHRMKCRVHDEFKLIVVADKETVQERFPTPLINRLEKHFLAMSTVLSEEGTVISDQLSVWAKNFATLDKNLSIGFQKVGDFSEGDCFIGYHNDTPSSIVFHVIKEMYPDLEGKRDSIDRSAVLERSQTTLLKMATTDAVLRVKNSQLASLSQQITSVYFNLQLGTLGQYLRHVLEGICEGNTGAHLTLATTHSRLLTERDVEQLEQYLSSETGCVSVSSLSLQQFQTEQQYSREIQDFLMRDTGLKKRILLVQCERGADNAKLIACARHKTVDELKEWREEKTEFHCEICLIFLIQLCREAHGSKFVSFCGGDWNTVHIDDIRSLDYTELPPISYLIGKQIYDLFGGYQMETDSDYFQICEERKLRECIQPAASLLEDCNGSEDRIITRIQDILLLIERNHCEFVNLLCERLRDLLQEQHDSYETEYDWLHQTANCGGDIQSSGTFHKAVNLKINKAITPLLAELLALLDRNGNLELALSNEAVPTCLVDLWHEIFRDPLLLVLKYKDILSPTTMCPRVRVPVLNDGAGSRYFKAHFPFSWLINQISSQLLVEKKRNTFTGSNPDRDWMSFESLFYETPLAKKLYKCLLTDTEDLILLYLRDFVHLNIYARNVHQHQVYTFVILNCIENYATRFSSMDDEIMGHEEKLLSIPRIHCAYEDSKQLIDLLKLAFSFGGTLAINLIATLNDLKTNQDKKLKCVELILLAEIIQLCSYEKERISSRVLADKYANEIKQWQSVIDRGLSFKQSDESTEDYRVKIRCNWNRLLAVQLFISYCTIEEFSLTETSIKRLYKILGESPDFTTAEVIKHLLTILSNCLEKLSGKRSELKIKFKIHATRFFISILTNLTFKHLRVGDRNLDLIELLMGFVTLDEKSISELLTDKGSINIFSTAGLDPSPAFRTFLLQLLIKHRQDVFREQISVFLRDTILNYTHTSLKRDLFLIIIQSIEDSLHQDFRQATNKLEYFIKHISSVTIDNLAADNSLSYELLERIATLRFLCIHISQCIIETYQFNTNTSNQLQLPNNCVRLIEKFKDICLLEGYEYLHTFLLKNMYHQLGSDTLHIITNCNECRWVIPEHVMDEISQSLDIVPDFFIIYGEGYLRITSAVEQVNLLQNQNALKQFFNSDINPDSKLTECLIYSVFQEVMKFLKKQPTSDLQSFEEALRTLKKFMRSAPLNLNSELSDLVFQITTNEFGGGHLPDLRIKPTSTNHELFLIRLVFHGAVMLCSGNYHKLLHPISRIYSNPASLRRRLFPTMMDDQFVHTKHSIQESGNWYRCPNGHPYFIGDCGRPVVSDKCPDCGSRVGGVNHVPDAMNSLLSADRDETKPGYLLRRVNNAKDVSSGERSLGPAAVKIIRILMDIAFIWSSCSKYSIDSSKSQDLLSLVKAVETHAYLPEFFYQHLERDLQDLSRHTGQNFEETVFLIHIVLKSLMETAKIHCDIPTVLRTRGVRDQWEKAFSEEFIQPLLSSIHTDVRTQMEQVLNEKRIANNPLLRVVYEREEPEQDNPLPYLWRYRTIVSLEHFSQCFSSADSCPLIDKFLREESKLYVTRYLPDIIQLQKRMRDRLLHRIDRREATTTRIKDFLDKVRLSENKQESEELGRLIESLATAWSIIGEEVRNNGRLRTDDSLNQHEITPATSLAYLLASSTGEGVLITSLTDYLVLVHNSFVHAYRDGLNGTHSDKIPLRELEPGHMIDYHEQIHSLLLSHAHYSLALGQGSYVTYDFEGVEKQFTDRFIQSKPLIVAEHIRFEYTREAPSDMFEQVRHRVKQTEVREVLWKAILEDLGSLEVVSDVLRVLDVVIGILSSAGGDPEQKLSAYLDVLRYSSTPHGAGPLQSRRAEGVLCLKHILSFWSLLSIERARHLSNLGQIPFSSLNDEYQDILSDKEKKQIERTCDRDNFSIGPILTYLHEFIVFFLGEKGSDEKGYGLKESIIIYAEENGNKLPDGLSNLPTGIKLSQTAAVWALLAQRDRISD